MYVGFVMKAKNALDAVDVEATAGFSRVNSREFSDACDTALRRIEDPQIHKGMKDQWKRYKFLKRRYEAIKQEKHDELDPLRYDDEPLVKSND